MACAADLDSKAYGIYKLMTASEWKVKARQYAHSKNRSRLLEKLEDFIEPVESDEETVMYGVIAFNLLFVTVVCFN
jgi:hypothetical protein